MLGNPKALMGIGDRGSGIGYRLGSGLLIGLLLSSVIGKLINPGPTLAVLRETWGAVNHVGVAFAGLIALETLVLLLLVPGFARGPYQSRLWTPAHAIVAIFVSLVSVSIVAQIAQGSSLSCGCGLGSSLSPKASQWLGLFRNALLVYIAAGLALVGVSPAGGRTGNDQVV